MKSVIIGITLLIVVIGGLFFATMEDSKPTQSRAISTPVDNGYSNFKMN